jgi:hypothetical protein
VTPETARLIADRSLRAVRWMPVLARLPRLAGKPIRILRVTGLRDRRGAVHAGSFLRQRRIAFDCTSGEFARVLVHELFHFVWLRLGNPRRLSYERLLRQELAQGARGELGWSSEWRKRQLRAADIRSRTHHWREYCCESFCDSAAWLYAGVRRHEEFTLTSRFRRNRSQWFAGITGGAPLSI